MSQCPMREHEHTAAHEPAEKPTPELVHRIDVFVRATNDLSGGESGLSA